MKSKKNLFVSLLTTSILVVAAFLIGYSISLLQLSQFNSEINILTYQLQQLQIIFLTNNTKILCAYIPSYINYLATQNSILSEQYSNSQSASLLNTIMYYRMEIWLYEGLIDKRCNLDVNNVLFFYSPLNSTYNILEGDELTLLNQKYPNKVFVVALNSNSSSPLIREILSIYNISKFPSILVNNKVYQGYLNYSALYQILINSS